MSVKKARVTQPFVIIKNTTARNENLSLAAKGLIMVMGSRPDDWIFHKTVLMKECGIGRDKLNSLFKELVQHGYLETHQNRKNTGKFGDNDYLFYIDPLQNETHVNKGSQPCTEKPSTAKPFTANQQLQIKITTNKDIKDLNNSSSADEHLENEFNKLWAAWPNNKDKKRSYQKFKILIRGKSEQKISQTVKDLIIDCEKRIHAQQPMFKALMLSTYIQNERWNDDITPLNADTWDLLLDTPNNDSQLVIETFGLNVISTWNAFVKKQIVYNAPELNPTRLRYALEEFCNKQKNTQSTTFNGEQHAKSTGWAKTFNDQRRVIK